MKKLITCLLLVVTLASTFTVFASAEIIEGRALDEASILDMEGASQEELDSYNLAPSNHIRYKYDTVKNALTIYCHPDHNPQRMLPYAKREWIPWTKYSNVMKTATIEEGVTTVGHYSFWQMVNLETVYLPHSITKVDQGVFYQCNKLETIYYAGTEEDFQQIAWIDQLNYAEVLGEQVPLKEKVHFGEHVIVVCVNEEGNEFDRYTVGGYNVGDSYSITPKAYDNLTYSGSQTTYDGAFKKDDATEIRIPYTCKEHKFIHDEGKECGSYCEYCGVSNPDAPDHTWDNNESNIFKNVLNLLQNGQDKRTCTVCGKEESTLDAQELFDLVVMIGIGLVALIILLLIWRAIRKRRWIKKNSW